MDETTAGGEILCVGEVLWDALPAGLFLGGAPFNVACHLGAAGLPVAMVSRVGRDRLGNEVRRRLPRFGVREDLVQVDDALPTGFVSVALDEAGEPTYEIASPAAWDEIAPSPALLARARAARAIVFGTLAQRAPTTRATLERLWEGDALLVLDLNLRAPYDDRNVVERSLRRAHVVKLSERELARVARWFGLRGGLRATASAVAERFGSRVLCVTRGGDGAALWREGRWSEHPGFEVEVRDTVGAGDAFLAVLLAGLLANMGDRELLQHANLMGAYVATQPGAVPLDQQATIAPPLPDLRPRTSRGL